MNSCGVVPMLKSCFVAFIVGYSIVSVLVVIL